MEPLKIDINVDVGEGLNNEELILPLVDTCNIACGAHAGDVETMTAVVRLAKTYNVKIGAHPSYPDRENFGRKPMTISNMDLTESLTTQIKRLLNIVNAFNSTLNHVKPHGALYNKAATDKSTAMAIVLAVKSISIPLKLFVPYNSVIAEEAQRQGIPIVYEAFADRNYNEGLTLVSRSEPDAVITDPAVVYDHVSNMVKTGKVKTINGVEEEIKADTFCVHGDNPQALDLIRRLRGELKSNHIQAS